jgi:hypothetical protein
LPHLATVSFKFIMFNGGIGRFKACFGRFNDGLVNFNQHDAWSRIRSYILLRVRGDLVWVFVGV